MKKNGLIILLLIFLPTIVYNQTVVNSFFTLSGAVVNGSNNKPLVGANLLSNRNIGAKTNEIGEFSVNIHPNDTIKISYIGFKTISYIVPYKKNGKYLIKFKMYKDSVSLSEIIIYPWPSYKEFKAAFLAINKQDEKIIMEGVKMYIDKNIIPKPPSIMSPASFIYDKLFDKQAKRIRRLKRRRKIIKDSNNFN
jgi:hypothetical protein